MQIVLATDAFAGVGGSETYLLTVAEQLVRLGHHVTISATRLGEMAELAQTRGVAVVGDPCDLPEGCDVALVQDGAVAYDLAERYPQTPQVFVCHSDLFDLQLPPLLEHVVSAVVVMSERVERRVRALDAPLPIRRLRQPIDTERFFSRSAANQAPQRALLLGNYLKAHERRLIVETWGEAGVEVVQRGHQAEPTLHPERDIAAVDIVVGKGRALLEGMACGRPAYLYDAFGSDGWVTPQRYPAMEADAFGGLAHEEVASAGRLRDDLSAYDPAMGVANRELILSHHSPRSHTHELVELFGQLTPAVRPSATPNRELARLIRLRWRAEAELFGLRAEFAVAADGLREAHRVTLELQTERAAAIERVQAAERAAEAAREQVAQAHAASAVHREALDSANAAHALVRADLLASAEAAHARAQSIVSQRRVQLGIRIGRRLDRARAVLRRRP